MHILLTERYINKFFQDVSMPKKKVQKAPRSTGRNKEVPKKTGLLLIVIGVLVAIFFTLTIVSNMQSPPDLPEQVGRTQGGDVTLTLVKQPITKDQGSGNINLELLPSGG
jgi:hypothetical protein